VGTAEGQQSVQSSNEQKEQWQLFIRQTDSSSSWHKMQCSLLRTTGKHINHI